MIAVLLYVWAGLFATGSLLTITSVGKPKKPTTGGTAAAIVAVQACVIATLVVAAVRLS